jgi:hypothetical protein
MELAGTDGFLAGAVLAVGGAWSAPHMAPSRRPA